MAIKFLEAKNLCFGYYRSPLCLKDINFSLCAGKKVLLLASEGMGKSTYLYVISGFQPSYFGQILVEGKELKTIPDEEKKFSYLPSEPVFFNKKTIEQNFEFFYQTINSKSGGFAELKTTLSDFGLNLNLKTKIKKLSLFERRMLSIVRSWLKRPQIFFIDDLLEGLSDEEGAKILTAYEKILGNSATVFLACSNKTFKDNRESLIGLNFSKVQYLCLASLFEMKSIAEFEETLKNINQLEFLNGFSQQKAIITKSRENYYLSFNGEEFARLSSKLYTKLNVLKLEGADDEEVILVKKGEFCEGNIQAIAESLLNGDIMLFSAIGGERVV